MGGWWVRVEGVCACGTRRLCLRMEAQRAWVVGDEARSGMFFWRWQLLSGKLHSVRFQGGTGGIDGSFRNKGKSWLD